MWSRLERKDVLGPFALTEFLIRRRTWMYSDIVEAGEVAKLTLPSLRAAVAVDVMVKLCGTGWE